MPSSRSASTFSPALRSDHVSLHMVSRVESAIVRCLLKIEGKSEHGGYKDHGHRRRGVKKPSKHLSKIGAYTGFSTFPGGFYARPPLLSARDGLQLQHHQGTVIAVRSSVRLMPWKLEDVCGVSGRERGCSREGYGNWVIPWFSGEYISRSRRDVEC